MIILDIDNCISDDSRRVPLIDWFNPDREQVFARYHADCYSDPAHVEGFQDRDDVIIITSRPAEYMMDTLLWLEKHRVRHKRLVMRPPHIRLPSPAFKVVALTALVVREAIDLELDDIEVAYDDRPDVLEAYRQLGLNAVQRKIHDLPYGGPA